MYKMRFITDANLDAEYICTKRTEKTATFERFMFGGSVKDAITRRVKVYSNSEYVLLGNYSMSPSITATNISR